MNFDKEYLKNRIQENANDLMKELTDSYFENDDYSEFDDIAMADVIYEIVDKVTNDDAEMDQLLDVYMKGLKRSREAHAVKYRDFGKYKLVIYSRGIIPQMGNTITVTLLDQRSGGNEPRDFSMKVIQLPDGDVPGIGETDNLNIGFTNDTIKDIN